MTLALDIESWTPQTLAWGTKTTPVSGAPGPDLADRTSSGRVGRGQLWALDGGRRAPHYLLCDAANRDRPMGGHAAPPLCHRAFLPGQGARWWVDLSRTAAVPERWDGYWPGWEPIRAALAGEVARAGWSVDDVRRITRTAEADRWLTAPHWEFIPRDAYESLAREAGIGSGIFSPSYDDLFGFYRQSRAAYEDDWRFLEPLFRAVLLHGEFVLELGGTPVASLLAAEAVDRRCVIIDPRPGVCEAAILKWEETTGVKADLA